MTHITSHSPLVLAVLQHVTVDRLQKAVTALAEGSLTMTLTRQTENEIRALVKNGEGKEYGVALTEAQVFCSCPDALYRGSVCKHATTLALAVLRGEVKEAKNPRTIHLAMQEGMTLLWCPTCSTRVELALLAGDGPEGELLAM